MLLLKCQMLLIAAITIYEGESTITMLESRLPTKSSSEFYYQPYDVYKKSQQNYHTDEELDLTSRDSINYDKTIPDIHKQKQFLRSLVSTALATRRSYAEENRNEHPATEAFNFLKKFSENLQRDEVNKPIQINDHESFVHSIMGDNESKQQRQNYESTTDDNNSFLVSRLYNPNEKDNAIQQMAAPLEQNLNAELSNSEVFVPQHVTHQQSEELQLHNFQQKQSIASDASATHLQYNDLLPNNLNTEYLSPTSFNPSTISSTKSINYIPYPVVKKLHVPIHQPVQIPVSHAIIMSVNKPMPIHIPVMHQVQVPVEKELKIPVERVVTVPVQKLLPIPVEKRVPYPVVKYVPIKVPINFPVKVPVVKTILHKIKSWL